MEKKVLFNVLESIRKGGTGSEAAPDNGYLTALNEIGMINRGWDTELTTLGRETLEWLRNSIQK
ncbi:hypothetical protein [Dyadobacter sp. CY312]|uniref:hypothetical protein n=1 Tax=Dyadobacter sp. CY312 TaxID=2907303 RepID=UPI001F38E6A0|nr:hypothetical protein [Dyadobacter sp. CY312]MCE7039214.1 hypothetical protein [Dyadobacter sp. CY312]